MAVRRRGGAVLRQVGDLFNVGTIGDLADGQLLERFATDPDEAAELAFAALVERHGATVWRACRAILRDDHDAEDAFQATFLVLVRQARSLWVRDSLGPWLHRVACRTAAGLRAGIVRRRRLARRRLERAASDPVDTPAPPEPDRDAAIHEELDRLPEKYRLRLLLCDLEGATHQQAARSLGWPIGTVKSRQSQARALLRDRLARRGLGPSVVAAAVESVGTPAVASFPPELARVAVGAAMRQAGRLLTGRPASSTAPALARGALRSMRWTRFRALACATLAIGIAGGGAVVLMPGQQGPAPGDRPPTAATAPAQPESPKPVPTEDVPLRQALDEAVKAARAIEDPSARRLALTRIATAQGALDDLTSARATAQLALQAADQIASPIFRPFALHRVAKLQAKLGDVASARVVFDRLIREAGARTVWDRMTLLGAVAMEQDASGLRADAMQTLKGAIDDAKKVVAETGQGDIYYQIVFAQCQIGDFDGVLRIVESLQGKLANDRQTFLQYLARDCDKAGPAEARRILAKALDLSKAIPYVYPRGLAQKMIAQAMARNGDIPGARAASRLIGQLDPAPAGNGLLSFLNGDRQAEMRRRGEEAIAPSLRHEVADVLAVIAAEQARAGDRAVAKTTFREAMDLILDEPGGATKTQRLRFLAEQLAGAGEIKAAEVAIEAIRGDEASKAHALVALAKARARAGDREGARASLAAASEAARETRAIPNVIQDNVAFRKQAALRVVATAQADLDAFADAIATAAVDDDKALRGEVQARHAGSQAGQGDIAAALKTAEGIEDAGSRAEAFRNIAHARSRGGPPDAPHDWAARLGPPHDRALALLGVVEGALARRRGE